MTWRTKSGLRAGAKQGIRDGQSPQSHQMIIKSTRNLHFLLPIPSLSAKRIYHSYMTVQGWPSGVVSGNGMPGMPGIPDAGIIPGPRPGMIGMPSELNSSPGAKS